MQEAPPADYWPTIIAVVGTLSGVLVTSLITLLSRRIEFRNQLQLEDRKLRIKKLEQLLAHYAVLLNDIHDVLHYFSGSKNDLSDRELLVESLSKLQQHSSDSYTRMTTLAAVYAPNMKDITNSYLMSIGDFTADIGDDMANLRFENSKAKDSLEQVYFLADRGQEGVCRLLDAILKSV